MKNSVTVLDGLDSDYSAGRKVSGEFRLDGVVILMLSTALVASLSPGKVNCAC